MNKLSSKYLGFIILCAMLLGCDKEEKFYFGADLSYVNEVEDGKAFYQENGQKVEPYQFFADKGCNLVRLRLWHNPKPTPYSNYEDVKKSIKRAKDAQMEVLLDFHYSDTWADPSKQYIPEAWAHIDDLQILGDSVYQYTYNTLMQLHRDNLLPEMVQVGNETNSEILQPFETNKEDIDWKRNAFLLNQGVKAVRNVAKETGKNIEIMLHIAQPENALTWFPAAQKAGIKDYDWIGLSYYPLWSEYKFGNLSKALIKLITEQQKKLMIVETSYPHTFYNADQANNILDEKSLLKEYPATPQGQRKYMIDLTQIVMDAGGLGVVYWEPAWVTSESKTLWGTGSHWDNATFFDHQNQNEALPAFDFFNLNSYKR